MGVCWHAGEGPAEMQSEHYGLTWEQVVEDVRSMVVPSTWQRIHPSFYICFWTLTFSDIHYPGALCALHVPLSLCNAHLTSHEDMASA